MVKLPVWVFHGAKDTAVSISASADMVHALKARGGDVRFTIYPDAAHDSWTATYENPELYEWLLAQRRE
jgi:predicted peptidase